MIRWVKKSAASCFLYKNVQCTAMGILKKIQNSNSKIFGFMDIWFLNCGEMWAKTIRKKTWQDFIIYTYCNFFSLCRRKQNKNKTKRLFPQFPIFILKQKRKKERKNEGTQRRIVGKMAFVFYILQSISPLAEHLGSVWPVIILSNSSEH